MSSSDPIALNDHTSKLHQHQWASSTRRTCDTGTTFPHGRLANECSPVRSGLEDNQTNGTNRNIPLVFSPPGFFTDRTYRDTLGNIAGIQMGKNLEPPAIPRSATLAIEEARLTRDSSLNLWMIDGYYVTSIEGSGDLIMDGTTRGNRLEGTFASNSTPSSADQLQLHPISDRTWRASEINRRSDAMVDMTIHGPRHERGQSNGEYERENVSLDFSDMMELRMNGSVLDRSAFTNGQHSSKMLYSKSSTARTISSSLEYPRLGSFVHLSQEMTDSLDAYETARRNHGESELGFNSASSREMSALTMSEVAVSTPLTAFAATQSTSRTADDGIPTASTFTQTDLGSVSKTMVGDQSNRSRRGGTDSTPLTAYEVSQEGVALPKIYSSMVQGMPSTPLSDYAAIFPGTKGTSNASDFVSPNGPLALRVVDEDGSSVEYGRRDSLSPLEDRMQDLTPRQCTPSSSDTGHSKSEHGENGGTIDRVNRDASLTECDVRAAAELPHRKSLSPPSHDATFIVMLPRKRRNRSYSERNALVGVQQEPVDLRPVEEQFRCLKPWGIVEDWNEIDRFELSVEYVV
ncbi:hypothetical protein QFC19_009116 [Naganishia cerealis]|uniref:Uncharacterized protein n=1 Tax=Naganishia cerealis TaxID=610337 RepID=A0ACC2UY44_9TREE|nr:hypothetical protein QFC19_009116 [Naganishia cerealis]